MSRTYQHYTCGCGVSLSQGGLARTAHERGGVHIAYLRSRNWHKEADKLQAEADAIKANNQRRRAAGTYGYKSRA